MSKRTPPASRASGAISQAMDEHLKAYFKALDGHKPPTGLYEQVLREVERPLIRQCLAATDGNKMRAAEILGLNRNTLSKKIRSLGLE
ncbi:MAG: helix-turn-helix domain-containing protein [Pseudomonadota bacterium]